MWKKQIICGKEVSRHFNESHYFKAEHLLNVLIVFNFFYFKSSRHIRVRKMPLGFKKITNFSADDWVSEHSLQKPLSRAGAGSLLLKAVSVSNAQTGRVRECSGCPSHTSNFQRTLNTTPISTKLCWSQNKLGIKHKCPDLELDTTEVFVLAGKSLRQNPAPTPIPGFGLLNL